LSILFCAHAIADPQSHFEVTDARINPQFAANPLVTVTPISFFIMVFHSLPEGFALGSLCVIDHKPGKLSTAQSEALQSLSNRMIRKKK
jgi:hypothetical protein